MSGAICPSCGKTIRKLHQDRVHGQLRVWHVEPHVLGDTPCMWPVGGASFIERDQLRVRVEVLTEALTVIVREFPHPWPESLSGAQKLTLANAHHTLAAGTAPTEGGQ